MPLAGRDGEVARLAGALEAAAAGQGCAVLVAGEAGIGKTRLLEAARERATSFGFAVLAGRAHAAEVELAYGPVADALDGYLRPLAPGPRRRLLADLDDLGRLLTGLDLDPPPALADAALERTRLVAAIVRLVVRLAATAPAVVAVDDVHWADLATLELLGRLGREIAGHRVLLLLAGRSDELQARSAARALVRSLRRECLLAELELGGLDDAAVAAIVRDLLGGEPPPELASLVTQRAQGVPLYVESLVTDLQASGRLRPTSLGWALDRDTTAGGVPALVRDLVLSRLERLAPAERHVLNVVALAGGPVAHEVVAGAVGGVGGVGAGYDAASLAATLARLRSARLLTQEQRDGVVVHQVAHPLVGEAAVGELSALERQEGHAALAAALEAAGSTDVTRLARHYAGAGSAAPDSERTVAVLEAAGERARRLHAHGEAALFFGAALDRLPPGDRRRPGLWERRGEAYRGLGDLGRAATDHEAALAGHHASGDHLGAARALRLLAEVEWDRGHLARAWGLLEEGLEAARRSAEPGAEEARGWLLHARATFCDRTGDLEGLAGALEELTGLGAGADTPSLTLAAHLAAIGLWLQRSDLGRAAACLDQALAVGERVGDPLLTLRALDVASVLLVELGDHRRVRACADQALDLAVRLGSPGSEMRARGCRAVAAFVAGRWDEYDGELDRAIDVARRAGIPRGAARALAMRAMVEALRNRFPTAEAALAEARDLAGDLTPDRQLWGTILLAEAWLALERGQPLGSERAAELRTPAAGLYPWRLMAAGELELAAGDDAAALATAGAVARFGVPWCAAGAGYLRGLAHAHAGRPSEAAGELAGSRAAFAALDLPWFRARADLAWAALVPGDDPEAAGAERAAEATFASLGTPRWAAMARRALRQRGVRVAPPRARTAGERGALSDRELEVARLASEGLTTAEIAARLVISRHTAATHLQRIYRRLDVGSRVALARRLQDEGLLS